MKRQLIARGLLALTTLIACAYDRAPAPARRSIERWTFAQYDEATKHGPTAVLFTAAWCGPCRQLHPTYVAFAQHYPTVRVGEVDIGAPRHAAPADPQVALHDIERIPEIRLRFGDRETRSIGIPGTPEKTIRYLSQRMNDLLERQ